MDTPETDLKEKLVKTIFLVKLCLCDHWINLFLTWFPSGENCDTFIMVIIVVCVCVNNNV